MTVHHRRESVVLRHATPAWVRRTDNAHSDSRRRVGHDDALGDSRGDVVTGQPHDAEHTAETCGECQRNRQDRTLSIHYWEPMSTDAVELARRIGTEHGVEAARGWLAEHDPSTSTICRTEHQRPEPELSDDELVDVVGAPSGWTGDDGPTFPEYHDAYCDAFRAAVRAEVMRACEATS